MASIILILIVLILFLYRAYRYIFIRPVNFPPGPPRIPFIGGYVLLFLINRKYLHLAVQKLCQYYKTNVIGFYAGNTFYVITNDQETTREALFNPDFDGRSDFFAARLRSHNFELNGIFFIDGLYWQEQRRFTLRNLRDFGFGRRFEEYELEVKNEIKDFIKIVKEGPKYEYEFTFLRKGGEISLPKALIGCVANCFLQVIAGERLSREEQGKSFCAGYGSFDFQIYADEYGKCLSIWPWIRFFIPKLSRYEKLRNGSMEMYNFMKEIVDRQVATYQDGHVRSFMDTYIKEMRKVDGKNRGFLYEQMIMICTDFLFPSLSAIETQVAFLLRHLLHRHDITKRIQDEIDDVVGQGRLPELNDRINLPYTEAAIREGMRFDTLVPSSVPHRSIIDSKLGGYKIPKDAAVLAGLFALHMSKDVWKDPENFRPERFLSPDGKLLLKLDKSLPFGAGRRICAGETFARQTIFLLVTAILQNFNLKTVNGLPDLSDNHSGLAKVPKDFWIKFESR